MRDILPDLPGLSEAWGRTVLHCPYCHGYELNRGRIGVIATGPMSVHQAQLLPEWGEITFLTNGKVALDGDARADLLLRGVTVEEAPIDRLAGHADVVLADGRILPFAGLFTATLLFEFRPEESRSIDQVWTNPFGFTVVEYAIRSDRLENQ